MTTEHFISEDENKRKENINNLLIKYINLIENNKE